MEKTKITFINGPVISQEEIYFLPYLDYKIISLTALPTFNSIENIEICSNLSITMLEHTTTKANGNKITKTTEYIIDLPLQADNTIFIVDDSIYSVVREIRNDFISKSKFEGNPISYVVKRYLEKTSAKSLKQKNKAMNNYTVAYVNDFNEVLAKCQEQGLMEGEFPFDKTSIRDSYIRFCNSAKEDRSIEAFIKMLAG